MSREPQLVPETLNKEWLQRSPLPVPHPDGDKEARGKVVIVAGSREMPGAAILAAVAAMRAGAGKLVVATGASIAALVAAAIPEARVVALRETDAGGIDAIEAEAIARLAGEDAGVLIGPGMQDETATQALVETLLPQLKGAQIILDALAMNVFGGTTKPELPQTLILTPHAGEMAHLTGLSKDEIADNAAHYAESYARRWNAVVVLKGGTTVLASPEQPLLRHDGGNVGLAISGSGDVLAGIIVGLLARGTPPRQAAAWGVALHAQAGDRLAERIGPLGFLAREIHEEVPSLMRHLAKPALGARLDLLSGRQRQP